jgi:methyl-accepting chemotaxis protein
LSFSTAPETEVRWASRQRQISQGTPQVSSNITDVQRGASETGSASMQLLSPAQTLSGDSQRLRQEVTKFLDSVRAA